MTILNLLHIAILLLLCGFLLRMIYKLWPLVRYARQPLPFIPISSKSAKTIAQLPELQGKQKIVDLGCGRGHLLAAIRKHHPTTELFGVEYNSSLLTPYSLFFYKRKNITVTHGDMFTYDISQMDAIVGWWIPKFCERLLPKFVAECKPGCVIVSTMFPLPAHPRFTERVVQVGKERVYVYFITPPALRNSGHPPL
ncbi:MAG: hypothetical protein HY565_04515 [Candidatus Kerfeldbacteria bacterium]|nr:hypothetical protein [Candidatus Kerfeldbacteria bacterium]